MKALVVLFSLAAATGMFAQTTRSFGSVVFPGGTSSTSTGITRNFGSTVFPGGAAVPIVHGGAPPVAGTHPGTGFTNPAQSVTQSVIGQNFHRTVPNGRNARNVPYVYAYPVYVGGADTSYSNGNGYGPQEPGPGPAQGPQNITVIYPPAQRATPVMIQAGPQGDYYTTADPRQGATVYESPRREPVPDDQAQAADGNRYLIAFKDHTIYSAVAYWADGDTLHYFTTGNTHNQASVSLIDRELTERLNKEMGIDFKLPAAK